MTPIQLRRLEEEFFRVRALPTEQREAALAAQADPQVRAELESLLNPIPEGFLGTPALGTDLVAGLIAPDPLLGALVGPYRVERQLGVGGMGAVYLAQRADGAFEQRVAIKVVKRGMDTDEILRRFRAERRTLANLQHPNIAVVHDGGSLPDGRPYLVMEYVDGRPISVYCQEHRLGTAERLRLFVSVCGAVQFAHQNLVVHRDLKPGNILVTADGAPKLLDFGIAKVLDDQRAATLTVTGLDQRRLTPEYASPEQVEGRAVTTASDVYSLGVILYELLVGRPPYRFETRTNAEILRIVTESTPQAPSTAVLARPEVRADATPARLRRELRGDLDNIVLTAMRKEPARRYASAEQFAADIDRSLKGMPIIARPATLAYRTAKFLGRHAIASVFAAIGLTLTVAGVGAVAWQSSIARHQRDQAFTARDQSEATSKFLSEMLAAADPFRAGGEAKVRQILDEAGVRIGAELRDRPLVQAAIRSTIGTAYLALGDYDKAERQIRVAYEQRLSLLGPRHHDTAESMIDLASLLHARGQFAQAEDLLRRALSIFQDIRGPQNPDIARVKNNLGAVLRGQGRTDEAAQALRNAIEIRRAEHGSRSLDLAESLNNYAGVLRAQNRLEEAEATSADALDIRRELLGADHPLVAQSMANLAVMIHSRGDLPRAEPLYRQAIDIELKTLGPDHPDRAATLTSLALLLRTRGDSTGAEPLYREALRVREAALPSTDERTVRTRLGLLEILIDLKRTDEAQAQLDTAIGAVQAPGVGADLRKRVYERAAAFFRAQGDAGRAAEFQAKADAPPG